MTNIVSRILPLLISLFFAITAGAAGSPAAALGDTLADSIQAPTTTKAEADSAYHARRYSEAAALYRQLPEANVNADILYNLGNAEYRQKHVAAAILAYQRALRLDPGHTDARNNLVIARAHIEDHFASSATPALITWCTDFIHTHSVATWVCWSLLWLIFAFSCFALYLFGGRMWLRKTGFFLALAMLVLFIITTVFAFVQRQAFTDNADAVVTAVSTQLYNSPSTTARKQTLIHEGTTVTIIDEGPDGWILVSLPDATQGWMKTADCERVIP